MWHASPLKTSPRCPVARYTPRAFGQPGLSLWPAQRYKTIACKTICYLSIFISCLFLPTAFAASDSPRVLVTIKPYHSLVSSLLEGITKPELLLDGYQSPHTFQLRPHEARALADADVIIWVGPTLETPLAPRLRHANNQHIIQITDADEAHHHHHDHEADPHRWLDPVITREDSKQIAAALIHAYPEYREQISTRLAQLTTQLRQLDHDIKKTLTDKPVSALLYHAAWDYFLQRYRLSVDGVIHNANHQAPGVRHLHQLSKTIERRKPRCLMIEPQFKPKYLSAIAGGHTFQQHTLDPLGTNIAAGHDMYAELMRNIARTFAACQ